MKATSENLKGSGNKNTPATFPTTSPPTNPTNTPNKLQKLTSNIVTPEADATKQLKFPTKLLQKTRNCGGQQEKAPAQIHVISPSAAPTKTPNKFQNASPKIVTPEICTVTPTQNQPEMQSELLQITKSFTTNVPTKNPTIIPIRIPTITPTQKTRTNAIKKSPLTFSIQTPEVKLGNLVQKQPEPIQDIQDYNMGTPSEIPTITPTNYPNKLTTAVIKQTVAKLPDIKPPIVTSENKTINQNELNIQDIQDYNKSTPTAIPIKKPTNSPTKLPRVTPNKTQLKPPSIKLTVIAQQTKPISIKPPKKPPPDLEYNNYTRAQRVQIGAANRRLGQQHNKVKWKRAAPTQRVLGWENHDKQKKDAAQIQRVPGQKKRDQKGTQEGVLETLQVSMHPNVGPDTGSRTIMVPVIGY